ncbi:alcohol dehydrogenase catalytic domain-containing protein [Cellulomonas cellasea]|uniref:alcohol dehydrogenase catalytic domain-containing protein n=1 Tax=Cellulomonas cellasea TaxID=43670 RepID=UPI0025A44D10|nr:alcohol dehydrogenase catalytic domain-containing protein [Cellulomonas cellasea]MDM8085336.1 alcohol dehydrogenase catalytic domain-containing protein [Cellulomonas cellasea]
MRATLMHGAGDVRVETIPDPALQEPTDAIVRVVAACVCGSDLHPYRSMASRDGGVQMGHEAVGIVEEIGSGVTGVTPGDLVIVPFAYQDNTCAFCRDGVQTSCEHGGFLSAAQAELLHVPQASGTLVPVPADADEALLPSLLTLSDVYLTGHHAAHTGRVSPGKTVTVIGDGAVGLSAVLASRELGAERIILMGRHQARTDLGREFGATDVVAERGAEGVAAVMDLTGGAGSHVVLEAVGHLPAYEQAYGVVRPGGVISRVGVPQYERAPIGFGSLFGKNATLTGGPAPVRAYIEAALPAVLEGRINPGRVFDRTLSLEEAPAAYRAMDSREALKVMLRP